MSADAGSVWNGGFDLGIFATSWDPRCCSITEAPNIRFEKALLLIPKRRDNGGLRERHDSEITLFLKAKADNFSIVQFDTDELEQAASLVKDLFWRRLRVEGL